jgi:hypothetical protein
VDSDALGTLTTKLIYTEGYMDRDGEPCHVLPCHATSCL